MNYVAQRLLDSRLRHVRFFEEIIVFQSSYRSLLSALNMYHLSFLISSVISTLFLTIGPRTGMCKQVEKETKLMTVKVEKSFVFQVSCFIVCSSVFFLCFRFTERGSMHGVKRVFAFCCLTAVLPALLIICPLYLKHQVFRDLVYSVAESDILEVRDGISTVFCQEHVLKMNTSFNAFQLNHQPDQSKSRKHIRLKKSLVLPDDTLEYWGFYLMKGATVELKVCSRYDGSRILVVKGDKNLRTCGLMDHNKNKFGANFNAEQSQVKVTFETAAEIVNSGEINFREENMRIAENMVLDDEVALNHGGEDLSDLDDETRTKHRDYAANYLKVDKNLIPNKDENSPANGDGEIAEELNTDTSHNNATKKHHKRRKVHDKHHEVADKVNLRRRRSHKHNTRAHVANVHKSRTRRDTLLLDGGINHGGNAQNFMPTNESDSISSFENALLECYDGNILVAKSFSPSKNCISVKSLETGSHLVSTHEVNSDGYYYYIFYSDNDYDSNNIHAVFDIWKPTYLYSNISETKGCINSTECRFPIQM